MTMRINERMRQGLKRLMDVDSDVAVITRRALVDNGRGVSVATGEVSIHELTCRVAYESGGVWRNGIWEGGGRLETTPCVFTGVEADLLEGDVLEWRGKRFLVNEVSSPHLGGSAVGTQARLTEIEEARYGSDGDRHRRP